MATPMYSGDIPAVVSVRVIPDFGHLRVRIWIGQEGSPGCVGELVMRPKDWQLFKHLIAFGADHPGSPKVNVAVEGVVAEVGEPSHVDHLPPALKVITDARVEEILAGLNGFVDHEYEGGTELVDGSAVAVRAIVGTDFNLDRAIEWALDQPETSTTSHSDQKYASVELTDGTVLEWFAEEGQWVQTIADEPEKVGA